MRAMIHPTQPSYGWYLLCKSSLNFPRPITTTYNKPTISANGYMKQNYSVVQSCWMCPSQCSWWTSPKISRWAGKSRWSLRAPTVTPTPMTRTLYPLRYCCKITSVERNWYCGGFQTPMPWSTLSKASPIHRFFWNPWHYKTQYSRIESDWQEWALHTFPMSLIPPERIQNRLDFWHEV